ncbi:armadillo-like helical domain containing protein 1 isoform X1 [Xenopus tropicalis]|uniref:Armadillo-like helical domain containing protein 1 isoform X1 n=1 Tax=Xenopus tropicalis TaxID=8364 RepID=A0A8J1JIE7_XENTR|nr:armadillo-like helical domain containing protein 1 isoform X1 [Xenopus tropicalis]
METGSVRNTLCFQVKPGCVTRVELGSFVKQILMKELEIQVKDIFCLQDYASPRSYDVTFYSESLCVDIFERFKAKRNMAPLEIFDVLPLSFMEEKPLILHMFNPFTDLGLILAFLKKYCSKIKGGIRQTNCFKIFNGNLKFWVKLRPDPDGIGGVKHPPANFSIAGNRGFLYYPGQPKYCRQCFTYGHIRDDCPKGKCCRNCGNVGHEAGACMQPRLCDICGSQEHPARNCPRVSAARVSYAEIVKRAEPPKAEVVRETGGGLSLSDNSENVVAETELLTVIEPTAEEATLESVGEVPRVEEGAAPDESQTAGVLEELLIGSAVSPLSDGNIAEEIVWDTAGDEEVVEESMDVQSAVHLIKDLMNTDVRPALLKGLVALLKPSQKENKKFRPHILEDTTVEQFSDQLPYFIQQAAAVRAIGMLSQESTELCEELIKLRVVHNLLFVMGNRDHSESQRQASLVLEYYVLSFPVVEEQVRKAIGDTLFQMLMDNAESLYMKIDLVQADLLASNQVNIPRAKEATD